MQGLRKKVINLAASIALQESQRTGEDYTRVLGKALDEACLRLGISKDKFIRMFI